MPGPQTIQETIEAELAHCETLRDILTYVIDRETWNRQQGHIFAARRYIRIRHSLIDALTQMEPEA